MKLPALFNIKASPEFVSDGCSGYMSWAWAALTGRPTPWEGYCVQHDLRYWSGGRGAVFVDREPVCTRAEADYALRLGIERSGHPVWAWLCWVAVRAGGSRWLPFAWRWSYRDRWPGR